ncbi:hypothetical protein ACP8HI_13490 [Paenibacillus sp. FA6]|uniref:hypothetical protein n=1 Tax=Paenibacillus sp. FA6 TaxID=3413029 RepID=UPI003F656B2C
MGIEGTLGDRKIESVDSGVYVANISFVDSTKELKIRGSNDIRIEAGLNLDLKGWDVILKPQFGAYIGTATTSNRILTVAGLDPIESSLDELVRWISHLEYSAVVNMSYDSATKNLKLYNSFGDQVAIVNLT